MNGAMRFLMGIGIVAVLVPALMLTTPSLFAGLIPDEPEPGAQPMADLELLAAAEDSPADPVDGASDGRPSLPATPEPEITEDASPSLISSSDETSSTIPEGSTSELDDTTPTPPSSTSPAETTPTSSATTTSPPAKRTGNTITGWTCPCTVKGSAELKGDVSLQGDLIVDGGTLVARPGVSVNGNGYQIMFMNGGRADFQGSKVFTWSDRGSSQNLQRDIVFRNMQRIMWMNGAGPSTLKYFTVADSGTSSLGDYPLHWHLNGNSVRGTVVEGVVVVNGKNHAYVPHGSNGITFKNVIAKNTRGEALWWDAPGTNESCSFHKFCTRDNSNNITYDHVLVDGVSISSGSNGYHTLSGFELGAGSGNVVRNSVAINVKGGKNCSGFHWPSQANQNEGGNVWSFSNNFSRSSDCHGIFVWQNDGNRHIVNGFNGGGIEHGAYGNSYEYANFEVPYLTIHASGWSARDGHIGTLVAQRHRKQTNPTVTLTNVRIDRFIIKNAGGDLGHYVLNNTGLSCGDVEYQSVESGTRVVVNGNECSVKG